MEQLALGYCGFNELEVVAVWFLLELVDAVIAEVLGGGRGDFLDAGEELAVGGESGGWLVGETGAHFYYELSFD